MFEPAQNRDPAKLHPEFLKRLNRYIAAVNVALPKYKLTIGEGRRTLARQRWLWSLGRTWWTRKFRIVTWTLNSMHRWGLANDLVLTEKNKPAIAIWNTEVWAQIYAVVPPSKYGLETLVPFEYNHMQIRDAEHVIATRALIGLVQT